MRRRAARLRSMARVRGVRRRAPGQVLLTGAGPRATALGRGTRRLAGRPPTTSPRTGTLPLAGGPTGTPHPAATVRGTPHPRQAGTPPADVRPQAPVTGTRRAGSAVRARRGRTPRADAGPGGGRLALAGRPGSAAMVRLAPGRTTRTAMAGRGSPAPRGVLAGRRAPRRRLGSSAGPGPSGTLRPATRVALGGPRGMTGLDRGLAVHPAGTSRRGSRRHSRGATRMATTPGAGTLRPAPGGQGLAPRPAWPVRVPGARRLGPPRRAARVLAPGPAPWVSAGSRAHRPAGTRRPPTAGPGRRRRCRPAP